MKKLFKSILKEARLKMLVLKNQESNTVSVVGGNLNLKTKKFSSSDSRATATCCEKQ